MKTIRPKRTTYNSIYFRSTLEARWAVFFDTLGVKYEYEPTWDEVDAGICYVSYKPDFYLPDLDYWVEVKPVSFGRMKFGDKKKAEGWTRDYDGLLILSGAPSMPKAGAEYHHYLEWNERKRYFWLHDQMWWCVCPKCGKLDIRGGGGIPSECDATCFPGPSYDLLGDETEPAAGHKSPRLSHAYNIARNIVFKPHRIS
jgi:hypothetical protein